MSIGKQRGQEECVFTRGAFPYSHEGHAVWSTVKGHKAVTREQAEDFVKVKGSAKWDTTCAAMFGITTESSTS